MNEQEAKKEIAQAKEELLEAKAKLKELSAKLMELSEVNCFSKVSAKNRFSTASIMEKIRRA